MQLFVTLPSSGGSGAVSCVVCSAFVGDLASAASLVLADDAGAGEGASGGNADAVLVTAGVSCVGTDAAGADGVDGGKESGEGP